MGLGNIATECGLNQSDVTKYIIKSKIVYQPSKDDEIWQEHMAVELMSWRNGHTDVVGFTKDELTEIFNYICTS